MVEIKESIKRPAKPVNKKDERKKYDRRFARIAEKVQQAKTVAAPRKAIGGIRGSISATRASRDDAAHPSKKANE